MVGLDNFFGAKKIVNARSAKIQIEIFKKNAKIKLKKDYVQEALDLYFSAKNLAIKWDLNGEIAEIDDLIRLTQITGLKELKKIYEKKAKEAKKSYNYAEAGECYDTAFKAASEIFKLGDSEMEKEIKRLKKKVEEFRRKY
jgi:hypothetical protein